MPTKFGKDRIEGKRYVEGNLRAPPQIQHPGLLSCSPTPSYFMYLESSQFEGTLLPEAFVIVKLISPIIGGQCAGMYIPPVYGQGCPSHLWPLSSAIVSSNCLGPVIQQHGIIICSAHSLSTLPAPYPKPLRCTYPAQHISYRYSNSINGYSITWTFQ